MNECLFKPTHRGFCYPKIKRESTSRVNKISLSAIAGMIQTVKAILKQPDERNLPALEIAWSASKMMPKKSYRAHIFTCINLLFYI